MIISLSENPFIVFDLDDTLFSEIEFLRSAFKEISGYVYERTGTDIYNEMLKVYSEKKNVFEWVLDNYQSKVPNCNINQLLTMYRNHFPEIRLVNETNDFLKILRKKEIKMGMITDGRSVTQRNKLKALDIEHYFSEIIISEEFGSEKPNPNNYLFFQNIFPGHTFYFIGDNTSKDFIVPSQLAWKMICVKDNGHNIHQQNLDLSIKGLNVITSFSEIKII